MPLIDTHLHLEELPDPAVAVASAVAAGVTRMITMGVDAEVSSGAVALATRHPEVFAAVGHHAMNTEPPDLERLRGLASHQRVVAVGEVGLDGTYVEQAPISAQREWLASMCRLALEFGLPVCVHTRDASSETSEVLGEHPGLTGVMHYFSLDQDWADRFLALGFHLSFAGLVTRPSRDRLREVVRRCPADRLLLETDSPYGTPQGRKPPNQPAHLLDTATLVAKLRGITLEELAELTTRNAEALFPKMAPAPA